MERMRNARNRIPVLISLCMFIVVLLLLYKWTPFRLKMFIYGNRNSVNNTFRDVNKLGVVTYHNVCLEINPAPMTRTIQFIKSDKSFVETLRIVVYNYANNSKNSMSVTGSGNTIWNYWDIYYNASQIPSDYTFHRNKAAYFIAFTCPGNFHHFFEDEFRVLQSLVSVTNRLFSDEPNQLFYRVPWDLELSEMDCYDVRRYEQLLMTLNFEPKHDVYYNANPNICFEHAVFGNADFSNGKRQATEFVLRKMGLNYDHCPKDVVTIIDRKTRRILNINDLINVTMSEGFSQVHALSMETLSMEDQIRAIVCTTILVGVQGAGLQWAVFMREGSTLIEIAWPQKHWGFMYNGFIPPYNIYHRGVLAKYLRVNWSLYQDKVRGGQIVPAQERAILKESPPKSADLDNIWKWADAIVDAKHYKAALRSHKYANSIKPFKHVEKFNI